MDEPLLLHGRCSLDVAGREMSLGVTGRLGVFGLSVGVGGCFGVTGLETAWTKD